jgi:hypothetical protein
MASSRPPKTAFRLAVICSLLGAGCAATFREPRLPAGEQESVWASYFVFGLVGRPEVDVRDHCPSGRASEVETGASAATVGITLITLGIYTPRRVLVRCEEEPAR